MSIGEILEARLDSGEYENATCVECGRQEHPAVLENGQGLCSECQNIYLGVPYETTEI